MNAAVGKPRVTVAVPAWNGAAYIEQAISSILAQTFEDFELLVIDDCSDDDTVAIVSRFDDPRIRVEANESRLGLVGNWNRCLEEASGEYVNIFHQDDVMAPDNLRKKIQLLDQHPSVAFVHSAVRQIDTDGGVLSEHWYAPLGADEEGIHAGRAFLGRLFSGENLVCCPSVVIRRQMVAEHGPFDPLLPFTADWEMWMRLCLFHDVGYLSERLVDYRRHAAAESERYRGAHRLQQCFMAKSRLLDKYGEHLPIPAWRTALTDQFSAEVSLRLAKVLNDAPPPEARALITLARTVLMAGSDGNSTDADWIARVLRESAEHIAWPHRSRADAAISALSAREARIRELETAVQALRASSSWRVTAPLRFVFRVLTGRSG